MLSFRAAATSGGALEYTLLAGPENSEINPRTGIMQWLPAESLTGTKQTIEVRDVAGPLSSSGDRLRISIPAPTRFDGDQHAQLSLYYLHLGALNHYIGEASLESVWLSGAAHIVAIDESEGQVMLKMEVGLTDLSGAFVFGAQQKSKPRVDQSSSEARAVPAGYRCNYQRLCTASLHGTSQYCYDSFDEYYLCSGGRFKNIKVRNIRDRMGEDRSHPLAITGMAGRSGRACHFKAATGSTNRF